MADTTREELKEKVKNAVWSDSSIKNVTELLQSEITRSNLQLLDELEKDFEPEGLKIGSRKELFTHKSTVMELLKRKRKEVRDNYGKEE